tara:strand:- start:608 stop:1432 length:825 start_codon:yes stop_codon:yes gene_type:complete
MSLRIIPKIDVKGKNLVKGVHLEGLRALGDPAKFSEFYFSNFADEIIYHDVVASLYERNSLTDLIKRVSRNVFIPFVVGGGIRNSNDVKNILASGADRIFINTSAIKNPDIIDDISDEFGSSTLIISMEVFKVKGDYKCYIDYGREETNIELFSWIEKVENKGAGEILVTSIDRDGTGKGFDVELSEKITKESDMPFIIGGGFGKKEHLKELLTCSSPSGIFISSALHYNYVLNNLDKNWFNNEGNFEFLKKDEKFEKFENITISELKNYINNI